MDYQQQTHHICFKFALWHIGDTIVPPWVNDCGNNNNKVEVVFCRDCEKRIGHISLQKSYKYFKTRRGGRTDNVNIQMKRDALSVTYEPLLRIDDDKRHKSAVDELHARQRMMSHLTIELCAQLQWVEVDLSLIHI